MISIYFINYLINAEKPVDDDDGASEEEEEDEVRLALQLQVVSTA